MDFEYVESFPNEEWRKIDDSIVEYVLPYYWVSNYGRIYSEKFHRCLSNIMDKDGYVRVALWRRQDRPTGMLPSKIMQIHRLVLMLFKPIPNPNMFEVNHINSIRNDNRLHNLEWVTTQQNSDHAMKYGYKKYVNNRGENCGTHKLTNEDVANIRRLAELHPWKYSESDIGFIYGVESTAIFNIINNKSWTEIESNKDLKDASLAMKPLCGKIKFEKQDIEGICEYLSTHNINDKTLYPTKKTIFIECLKYIGHPTDEQYYEQRRKTLNRILLRSFRDDNRIQKLISDYNYYYYE